MARQRLAWLIGLVLAGVGLAGAEAQLATSHLTSDAAALALAQANGGAIRFATEARIRTNGKTTLLVRLQPFGDAGGERDGGGGGGGDDRSPRWPKGVPVPFLLTGDGQGNVTLTVTLQGKPVTVHNGHDLKIVGDFTDLFVRARVRGKASTLTFTDLQLNGLLVGDGATANGAAAPLDILHVAGGQPGGGFQLSGHITASWQSGEDEGDDAHLDAMIWGAKIVGSSPDTLAPGVAILQPNPGSFLTTGSPNIVATFSGGGADVDLASVLLLLDGANLTAQAQVSTAGLTFTPAAALAEGQHQVLVFARNHAGVSSQAVSSFTTDTVPPSLAITAPTSPVIQDNPSPAIAVTYSDATSGFDPASLRVAIDGNLLTTQCQVGAAAASCTPPALAAGNHLLKVWGRDRAGNLTIQSFAFHLVLDTTPPTLTITAPTRPLVLGNPSPPITLAYADSGSGVDTTSLRVLVDQLDVTASCTAGPAAAQCQPPRLARGAHTVTARISDRRGNQATATASFTLAFPVAVAFTAPQPEQLTAVASVHVAGTVAATATSVSVNGVAATLGSGTFTIDTLGLHEGINHLVAVAQDADGNVGTTALRVIVDTTPPRLSISSPVDRAVVSSASVTVTGLVNDLTVGTVNQTQATVSVNGVAATVAHRSFVAAGVPLAPGGNVLVAVATDRAGNQAKATIHVTLAQPSGEPTIQVVSGDGQSGTVSTPLASPLVVAVADPSGKPLVNTPVVFKVAQGNGSLAGGGRSLLVRTDAQGHAAASWILGTRAGAAVNRLRVTAAGVPGDATFSAQAAPGPPAAIFIASGDDQNGAVGSDLTQAFFAVVFDQGDNPVASVSVTFKVVQGGGGFAGAPSVTVPSDGSGLATARLTLGPQAGLDNNRVQATFPGATQPATFKASGFLTGDPAQTAVAGIVLDNQGAAVPGVTIRLRDSAVTTVTDPGGQFRLTGVPVGQLFLIADASTATRTGSWASLEYEMFTLAGIENHLPKPIYILPLALAQGVFVDETHGGTVTIPGVPGFALDVAPGSVNFPGGGKNGTVSVTAVHVDKIPMPPGAGMQPRIIVTIQPAGARFEPPARLSLPNVDGRAPGSVTELFSFDHALGAFVSVGTGTVSEDGLVLQSDPGFGVVEAGWHCGAPADGSGDAQQVNVTITDPKPFFLCGDKVPADMTTLHAMGGPPQDASYSWQSGDAGVLALSLGQGVCQGAQECDTQATAGSVGRTNAMVTITCSSSGATASDSANVVVASVASLQVANATPVPTTPNCYVTNTSAAADDVHITAAVNPGVGPGEIPPAFLAWMGGLPGASPLERLVTRGAASSTQLQATCGGPVQPQQQAQLFVVDAATPPANTPANLVHILGGAANPGNNFGLTEVRIGQQGVVGPDFDANAYLDGINWRFRVPEIRHTYKLGINPEPNKHDVTGVGDPAITKATLCQIVPDLTPPPAGTPFGPPRVHYWSMAITQAHENCHVNSFYGDPAFWPHFMMQFQQQVENDSVAFDCQDPTKQNKNDVIAGKRHSWQQTADDLHAQAFMAACGAQGNICFGAEVTCHGVSNPMYTDLIKAIKPTVRPLDPTALGGAAASGHISLSWNSQACNETGFRIERKTNAANSAFAPIGNSPACPAPPCNPTFVDLNVKAGTTYLYRVFATGQAGDSNPTPVISVTAVP